MSRFHPFPRRLALLPLVVITLVIVAHQLTATSSAEPAAGGSISGTVIATQGGVPLADAYVYVLHTNFSPAGSANTAANGTYTVENLEPGSYYVGVRKDGGYGGVYFDNACDDAAAEQVTVVENADTGNIDFSLGPDATITGHVYMADGVTPLEGAVVQAWPKNGGQAWQGTSAPDGSYLVGSLNTCEYVVRASKEGYIDEFYDNKPSWDEATIVHTVQPGNTSGIDFSLDTGGFISGRVVDSETGQPVGDADVYLNGWKPVPPGYYDNTVSDSVTGEYRFDVPPGTYHLNASKQGYAYSSWIDSRPYTVSANQGVSGIELALPPAAYVRPTIFEVDGVTPLARIGVGSFSLNNGSMDIHDYISQSDDEGQFDKDLVIPAGMDVYLQASPSFIFDDHMRAWYSSTGSVPAAADAEPLNLAIGEIKEISFSLSKAPNAVITPAAGGQAILEMEQRVIITFPPGAVTEEVKVVVQPRIVRPIPPLQSFTTGFWIIATNADGDWVNDFAVPFTITIEYEDQHIPTGVNESDLSLYHDFYPPSGWQIQGWAKIPTTVDTVNNNLTAEIDYMDHITEFRIMAPQMGLYLPTVSAR